MASMLAAAHCSAERREDESLGTLTLLSRAFPVHLRQCMCTGEWPSHGHTEDCMRTLMQAGQSHGDDHGAEGVGTGRRMMGGLRCGCRGHCGAHGGTHAGAK